MNILCNLFGHQQSPLAVNAIAEKVVTINLLAGLTETIDEVHGTIEQRCPRCGKAMSTPVTLDVYNNSKDATPREFYKGD